MTLVLMGWSAVAFACFHGLILTPFAGSQDPSAKVVEILRGLDSPEWDDRKKAVGKIMVDQKLMDGQEIRSALLGTCRNLLDDIVTESDHFRHDRLLRDIVQLVRQLQSLEALPCLMDLPMDNGWISVSWVQKVVGTSFDSIIKLLEDGNRSQKSNAVRVLSSLHPELPPPQREKVKGVLMRYADDDAENPEVRVSAIYGLVVYPEAKVVELLQRIAREDAAWHMISGRKRFLIRESAVEALEMIQAQ